jgi:hypothetical protein
MTNDLAVRNDSLTQQQAAALAIKPGQTTWDDFQNAALNQLGLEGASNADRAVFLHQCQRTGLDPFARQIMMIGRQEKVPGTRDQWRTKWTIQTGIEGWRTIRDRAEKREGVRGILSRFTYYDHEDNERKVWTRREPPAAVEVTYTVRDRNNVETPYTSVLRYDEYVQTKKVTQNGVEVAVPVAQWLTKPVHMTEKCTEADVYRRTFPQDYAGIELSDAMPPPDPDAPAVQPQRQRVTATDARANRPATGWDGHAERLGARVAEQRAAETVMATVVDVQPNEPPAPDPTTSGASPSAPAPASASPTTTAAPPPSTSNGSETTPDDGKDDRPALPAQVKAIHTQFTRLGYGKDDRDARLRATARLTSHDGPLTSTEALPMAAAYVLIRLLAPLEDAAALDALLNAPEAPNA